MAAHAGHQGGSFGAFVDSLAQERWREIFFDCIPGGIDGLFTVKWVFAGDALAPALGPVSMDGEEQNAAFSGAAKAGLKKVDQRHANLAQGNGFDFHGAPLGLSKTSLAADF